MLVAVVPLAGVALVLAVTLTNGLWPGAGETLRWGGILALAGAVATTHAAVAYLRQARRRPGRLVWRLLARALVVGSAVLLALVLAGAYILSHLQVV